MSAEIYILTITMPFLTAIIVFAMKYAASFAAARARSVEQNEFRMMAEAHAAHLEQVRTILGTIEVALARQSQSLCAVETILKQVG